MKRRIIGLFLSLVLCSWVQAGDLKVHGFGRVSVPVRELADKPVFVRVYQNWQEDPTQYELVKAMAARDRGRDVVVLSGYDPSVPLVIMGQDQKDPSLRETMGHWISIQLFGQKGQGRVPRAPSPHVSERPASFQTWHFKDALGNPIAKAEVTLWMYRKDRSRLRIGHYETGGRMPRIGADGGYYPELVIACPGYGIARVRRFVDEDPDIYLPLLPETSEYAARAIRGTVLDEAKNPVANAEVTCLGINAAAGAPIRLADHGHVTTLTDSNGLFSYCMRPSPEQDRYQGRGIPGQATYHMKIQAPRPYELMPYPMAYIRPSKVPSRLLNRGLSGFSRESPLGLCR
jgi:hypothetical protein